LLFGQNARTSPGLHPSPPLAAEGDIKVLASLMYDPCFLHRPAGLGKL